MKASPRQSGQIFPKKIFHIKRLLRTYISNPLFGGGEGAFLRMGKFPFFIFNEVLRNSQTENIVAFISMFKLASKQKATGALINPRQVKTH